MNPTTVCVVTISLFHAFVLFTPSSAALTNTTETPIVEPETRVVGGANAREGQFPYQVKLTVITPEDNFMCGGALLTSKYVLTAAHCIEGYISVIVMAGFLDINKGDGVTAYVIKVHMHEQYNFGALYNNDIALLELELELPIDGFKIATIPIRNTEVMSGTCCVVSGWGALKENGDASSKFQYVSVPIVDSTVCSYELLNTPILAGQICAGYKSGGKDSCQGDSGGPLVCDGLLTGVVSWGDGCARRNRPGVYTNVHFYQNWLRNIMGSDLHLETPSNNTSHWPTIPYCSPDSAHPLTSLSHVLLLLSAISALFY